MENPTNLNELFGIPVSPSFSVPVKTLHKDTYAAISPAKRPELRQTGKTVLVTGSATGVGNAVAKGFAHAGASAVILTGRREDVLSAAADKLKAMTATTNPELKVYVHKLDVGSLESIAALWAWLAESKLVLDVLVLSAAKTSLPKTVLDAGLAEVWKAYEVNARGHMAFAEYFYKQVRDASRGPAVLVNVTSASCWDYYTTAPVPVYSVTKNAGVMLMQAIARDVPADKLRIVTFHPGLIRSESAEQMFPANTPYDTHELVGDFAVWLASPEAEFLHGRYVEAPWDIDELRAGPNREKIDQDKYFLQVGIVGLHP